MALAPQRGRSAPSKTGPSKFITFTGWEKMNTKVARQNLPDNQAAWMENLQPIAPNVLRAVPGNNTALTTVTGKTAAVMFQVNLGTTDYIIFFATDGSCTAINVNNGTQTVIAAAATFSTAPDLAQFASSRLLFMDATSGYATWDGTLFVKSGGISPNINITGGGAGYTSAPAVSFTGGAGNNAGGAAATATIAGGAVVSITVTNPGTGNAAGAAITVVLTGGGFSTAATATVVVWPQITGTTIAVGFGRVWYGNVRLLGFTGTGASTGQTWDDINPADAAGSLTISDSDLPHRIFAVRFLNNFLYIFGDGSIKQIGSITVSGSVTLFTLLTLASDVGTTYKNTIASYNRIVVFANVNGVYGIFGASVQKMSDDLDGIFENLDTSLVPSASLNDVHVFSISGSPGGSIHCYLLLIKYFDPLQGVSRTIICVLQGNKWFIVNAGSALLAMCGNQFQLQWETFVSSGADVTQILQNVNAAVQILLITSLSSHNNPIFAKQVSRSGIAVTAAIAETVTMTVDTENGTQTYDFLAATAITWLNNAGQAVQWQNNALANINFLVGGFKLPDQDTEGYGKFIGNTVSGSVQGLAINMIANEYVEAEPWGKNP